MFRPEDIQSRLRQRPFVPLRLVTSTGQTYDVYHPELVMVGQRDLMIGTASKKNPSTYDDVTRLAILHVTELRDLPGSTKASEGNGSA